MRKISSFVVSLAGLALFATTTAAESVRQVGTLFRPFGAQVCVEADEAGRVSFHGPQDLIGPYGNQLRQFCADHVRDEVGCGFDIDLDPVSKDADTVVFQLDPTGLEMGQHGFNLHNGGVGGRELWLGAPDQGVIVGRCLEEVWSDPPEHKKNDPDRHPKDRSAHFVWTCGSTKYPLKIIPNQGKICGQAPSIPGAQAASAQPAVTTAKVEAKQTSLPSRPIVSEKVPFKPFEAGPGGTGALEPAPETAIALGEGLSTPGLESIYFDFDQSVITSRAMESLRKNAEFLKENPSMQILVEGNCDERGTTEYNLALGERRAKSAIDILADLGVDPNRMETLSLGEERPLDPKHNEEAWAKNRRADFVDRAGPGGGQRVQK